PPKRSAAPAVPAQAAGARALLSVIALPQRVAKRHGRRPHRGGPAYYRRTARKHVPPKARAGFLPLYREAGRRYGVNWRLIASIHRQETAFSTEPTTYHGLNAFGCCAGPMQFNVTNGPVSTWERYRQAFRTGRRPKRYPHRTRSHPSVYDDFDAIMAAGALLSDSGAGGSLDSNAWRAAYGYYGHDLFGVTYADQVLARAVAWQRDGFCLNCGLDDGLVAQFEEAYGEPVRRQLIAAERRRKKHKHHKHHKHGDDHKGDRHHHRHHKGGERGSDHGAPRRSGAGNRRPSPPRAPEKDAPVDPSPSSPMPTQPSAPPPTTPPPAAPHCSPIHRLLGC
ncbi:MAG: lytic transglycosylase domain-containing protein, partial [Actinomycetota bacterium]|nr:lytic transglycosylase domain-containing protein [Actinomycetota bacterium]